MAYPFGNASRTSPIAGALNAGVRRGLLRRRRRSSGLLSNFTDGAAANRNPEHRVSFEPLEPRLLLSADVMPFHVDMSDPDIGDDITLRLDSDTNTLEVYQNANPALGPVVSQKLEETSEIVVEGVDDRDDTLTVDFSDPFFVDITFDGGAGGFDSLELEGGHFDSVAYKADSADAGTIEVRKDSDTATITYAGLEPIDDNLDVDDRVITFDGGDERIRLRADPNVVGSTLIEPDGGAAFESISFANPNNSLTVIAGAGNDAFILEQLDTGFTVTLDGGDDFDSIEVTRDDDFTLSDGSLVVGAQGAGLVNIENADLSVNASVDDRTFDISNWSGDAALVGGTGTDTVAASGSGVLSLGVSILSIDTRTVTLTDIDVADLSGNDSANEFSVAGWARFASLTGQGGDDSYRLEDGFGIVTITELAGGGNDLLDVTGVTGQLTVSTTNVQDDTISDGASTVTQTDEIAERIDATIDSGDFDAALEQLRSFVDELQAAGGDLQALTNQLPLLDREADGGIADVVKLTDSIAEFVDEADDSVQTTFQELVDELDALVLDPGSVTDTLEISATNQGYQSDNSGNLALLVGLALDADRTNDDIDLDFGISAGNRGIGVEGSLAISAALDVDLTLGFTSDPLGVIDDADQEAFVLDTGTISLVLNEARATLDSINLGFLALDVISGDATLNGRVDISFVGPGPIPLAADPLSVTTLAINPLGADYFDSTVSVEAAPGVNLGDGLLSAAAFNLSLPAGANPFGDDQTGAIEPIVDISATGANGRDIDLTDFANISAAEIIGMLGEISDLLGKIAGSQFLDIGIPFSELDLGDVLNLGGTYKETVLDPLFVSGDALRPDNNEDGQIDARDLTFSSIQALVERLESVLDPNNTGLSLLAVFDSGAHVSTPVADPDEPDVTTQTITVHNAQDGTYILGLFGAVSQPILWNAKATRAEDDTESLQAKLDQMLASTASPIRVRNVGLEVLDNGDRVYQIEFTENPVDLLTLESDSLVEVANPHSELTFRIEFDTSFGFGDVKIGTDQEGGDGLNEVQTIEINAVDSGGELDDVFTLAIRANADGAPFVTERIAFDADDTAIAEAIRRLGATVIAVGGDTTEQELRLRNTAGNGTFTLSDGTSTTAMIDFSASSADIAQALQDAGFDIDSVTNGTPPGSSERLFTINFAADPGTVLQSAGQIGGKAVTVEVARDGDVFDVTFTGDFGGTDVPIMTADSSELMGAFEFDLGASLGELASITSSGSFSPLVNLDAGLTFGLDLSPSQELTVVPPAFAPAPRVTVVTAQDGGGSTAERQIVRVQSANAGTFALTLGDKTLNDIDFDVAAAQLLTDLNTAFSGVATVDTVELDDTKEGIRSYTITFIESDGDVREMQGIGTGLEGIADNGQLVADADFTVEIINGAFELAGAGMVRDVPERTIGTITVTVLRADALDNQSLDDLREDVQRAVDAQLAAMGFSLGFLTDGELSTGALEASDPAVTGAAGVPLTELLNDLDFSLIFEQQVTSGQAGAPAVDDDPFTTLRHTDALFTSKVKVGDIVVRGSETAVVRSVDDDTIVHTAFTSAWAAGDSYEIRRETEVTSQLRAVDVLDGPAFASAIPDLETVADDYVVTIGNAGGGTFRLTVAGSTFDVNHDAPANNIARAEVNAQNPRKQVVTIERATGGSFTLTLNGVTTAAIAHDARATGVGSVSEALTNAGIEFESVTRSQTENDVTYIVTFADDPGAAFVADAGNLESNSLRELLDAAGLTDISVSVDTNSGDNLRIYTLTRATDFSVTVDGSNLEADGLLLNEDGSLRDEEAGRTDLTADDYVTALQAAIDAALAQLRTDAEANAFEGTEFGDFSVTVGVNGNSLTFQVDSLVVDGSSDDHTLELKFRSPIQVDAGGGRLALSSSPVLYSTSSFESGTRIDRRLQIEIVGGYDDAAYQQLGLLSAPTSFSGVTTDDIGLQLIIDGDKANPVLLSLAAGDYGDIDGLVAALQAALSGTNADKITVERVKAEGETEATGNRIQFKAAAGVGSIQVIVPATLDDGMGGTKDNGAITELGFDAGEGEEKRGKATEFFVDDVGFTGDFRLVAEDLGATASLGFLGIRATGSGTIGDAMAELSGTAANQTLLVTNAGGGSFTLGDGDRTTDAISWDAGAGAIQAALQDAGFTGVTVSEIAIEADSRSFSIVFAAGNEPDDLLEADDDSLSASGLDDKLLEGGFSLELRNPTNGKDRLTPGNIVKAFEDGDFFFDREELVDDGKTGFLDGTLFGEFGAEFGIAPDGFLSGLSDDLNAGFEISLASPNWLEARPALSDELGFGDAKDKNGNDVEGPINFTGVNDLFTLGKATQANGQLTKNLSFLVSNDGGITEALGVLNVSDTKPAVEVDTTTQGSGTQSEIQVVTVRNASDGTFTLTLGDQVTRKIIYDAPATGAGSVQSALEALSGVAIASVTKSGSGGEIEYTITFEQGMANVDEMSGNAADLSRGRAELQADLQKSINLALAELGDNLDDKIRVSIDGDGKVRLEGDAGFRIRLNSVDVEFKGPDFDDLLDRFRNFSFDDIIFALKKAVEFLQTLDGSDGGDAEIPALTVDFPLIERSISDLLDPASDFLDFVDEINSDPAGSLQKLNIALANALGFDAAGIGTSVSGLIQQVSISDATAGTFTFAFGSDDDATTTAPISLDFSLSPADLAQSVFDALTSAGADVSSVTEVENSRDETNGRVMFDIEFASDPGFELIGDAARLGLDILSLNPLDTSEILIDFKFAAGVELSRPFNLDLIEAFEGIGLPDFIADFVGVDASGTLSVAAGVDLGLAFGIDLSGDDMGIYLRIDDTGIGAQANASAGDLDFSAKLGPFGVFVVDGEAGLVGSIDFGLLNPDGDNRFDLFRFGSAVSVEAVTTGDTSVQLVTVRSAGAGTFTLGDGVNETAAIDWNASADTVLDELLAQGFDVQGVTGGDGGPYTITFNSAPTALLEADGDDISRSDLGRVSEFFSLEINPAGGGGIQVDVNGAAVLPLAIGTEADQVPIDTVVATFEAREIFDDDAQGDEDDGISVGFADVTEAQDSSVSDALLRQAIEDALGLTVESLSSATVGNDRVVTILFGEATDRLIATSASSGLIVRVAVEDGSEGRVQRLTLVDTEKQDDPAEGTFRLATPSTFGADFFLDLELPGLFALLSDPAVVVDGLDRVLQTVQDALSGQVFGVDLPFVGDLLADNPAANIIGDFRNDLLKPLSNTIRENNLNLDGLIDLIKQTLFDALGPDGIDLLQDRPDDDDATPGEITIDDIRVLFLDSERSISDVANATALQFDFDLGQDFQTELADIEFDLGIDALGIEVDLAPQLEMDWNLHVGFGIDQSSGFYFASETQDENADGELVTRLEDPNDPDSGARKELDLNLEINFGDENETRVDGRLIFLALGIVDGIDTDGDGIRDEFTRLFLDGGIDVMDPNEDGRLTFSEMTSASLEDIFAVGVDGGAQLRIDAMVDFSTIDESLASVLPQISTDIVADFLIEAQVGQGITVHAPEVAFLDVTLDLGSFISDFAGPILEAVADVLGPLDFLIGPDGFLNKRIPLLSDLLGRTVTGKDLVALYDPVRGPQVVAFLDFVDELYFLATLVTDAAEQAEGGDININFGDLVLFDNPDIGLDLSEGGRYVDQFLDIGLPLGTDLRDMDDLDSGTAPSQKDIPPTSKPQGSKTKSFTKGVTESGSIMFPILQPENIFKLLMGQTTTLVQIELPEFGFDFFYRQKIPIYGPIVGTVAGGISSTIDMGFGYDTLGLEQFLVTGNPANLINGFFLSDTDPATGEDRIEVSLDLEIAVGAGLSAGFITAGVEGGFAADIDFNLSDLNNDTKVRFDEMLANVFANSFIPLAIFDVSGMFEVFLRAFYEINLGLFSIDGEFEFVRLKLFEFNIPFNRPSILAAQNGDTLTLNIGPNADGRLHGDLRDIAETIHVETKGDGVVVVWSDQFDVSHGIASINPFIGVRKIVVEGGAGDDFIDLSGVMDEGITIEASGGDGNDTIRGGLLAHNVLRGGGGRDTLTGGDRVDEIYGDDGKDTLRGLGNRAVPIVRVDRVPGTTDQQRITYDPATAGSYTLISDGVETDPIAHDATAGQVLQALIDAGIFESDQDGTVEGGPGNYLVTFTEAPLRPMQAISVGVDELYGGDGNDTLDGGEGADYLDGGAGDDNVVASSGDDILALASFGSSDVIDGSSGSITLDFSGKSKNLVFFVQQDAILVGFGEQLIETAEILTTDISANTGVEYFSSQLIVTNPDAVEKIIGGDFDDTFHVQGTSASMTLDGGKGNDRYLLFSGTDPISVDIDDRGNPWNSGDFIDVIGTTGDDTITLTSSAIMFGVGQTASYVPPPLDSNILAIRVRGDNHDAALAGNANVGGDDTITIASTDVAVPVRVETGRGNDTVIVGDGTVDNIAGILRPGVNSPFGLGPLVLVGDVGHDTVIVDDSADDSDNFGNSSAVLENRQSEDDPVEIGIVSGLDMTLLQDDVERDGRIEFEGFEVVDVRLGTGSDFFTLGGGFNLGLAADDPLRGRSEDRQLVDTEFSRVRLAGDPDADGIFASVDGITGMTFVSGGDEAVTGAVNERQNLLVAATFGSFQLAFTDPDGNRQVTGPIAYNAGADDIQQALIALSNIGERDVAVEVLEDNADAGADLPGFVVEFRFALGGRDIEDLEAIPLDLVGTVEVVTSTEGMPAGGGGDVINVIATNDLDSDSFDRDDLNDRLGLLATSTVEDGGSGVNERQRLTIADAAVRASAAFGSSVGYFTLQFGFQETRPIAFDADADEIRDALVELSLVGSAAAPNVTVTEVADPSGNRTFEIEFVLDKAELDQAQITAKVVPLAISGGGGIDQINVGSVDQTAFLMGGADDDRVYVNVDVSGVSIAMPDLPDPQPNTMNGVNATITLDGGEGSDFFDIDTIGGTTDSLINVFDSGIEGFDRLTVFGLDDPDLGDLFLLRAGDKEDSLAFIALMNSDDSRTQDQQPLERVNYNTKLEQIIVEGLAGDDEFYIDDTRAAITINGGLGDDFFQIGQLYKTARTTAEANVAPEDVFATVETTRGFLSNGISDPMTINGGRGEDEFIVFRNLAVLTLNGGDNNDTFLVQAFALVGSVEDERARTDITGDAGADQIQYAVNAPVQINGGDGLDTVIVIGTEFNDDFVVTDRGVFGGGLNVNFINIESLEVDGAEGDDRFFILSTGENFVTKLVGSKGNDTFNVNGPTPENGVISNDLLGHSGIIEHDVLDGLPAGSMFQGLEIDGISANVADNDEPAIVITPSDGASGAYAGSFDDYTVVLSRPPRNGTVRITVVPPKGLVLFRQDLEDPTNMIEVRNQSGDAIGFDLLFDSSNWFIPQTVGFALDANVIGEPGFELPELADIEHSVSADEDRITGTVSDQSGNGDFIPEEPGLPVSEEARLVSTLPKFPLPGPGLPESLRGSFVVAGGQTRMILAVVDEFTLILDRAWNEVPVGETFQILGYSGVRVPNVRVQVYDPATPDIIVEELGEVASQPGIGTDSASETLVAENAGDGGADFIQVRLSKALMPGESVTVDLKSSVVGGTDVDFDGQLRFLDADGNEITSLTFDDANPYDRFQLVRVVAFDDGVVEGFHNVDLVLEATGAGYDGVQRLLVAAVADDDAPGVRVVESDGSTNVIEFDPMLIEPIPITVFELGQTQTGSVFSPNELTFSFDLSDITIDGDALLSIAAIADLDWIFETLTLDAEGVFSQVLFGQGGTQYGDSVTTVEITEEQLLELVADDGVVTFTVTPSLAVGDLSDFYERPSELTLSLAVFSEIEGSIDLAIENGLPALDSYQIVLTQAPQAGETVTVRVDPRETRTSRTGGIVTFADQVEVSLDGINYAAFVDVAFTDANWNLPQTIHVRALDDLKVDGGDTKVFAPMLDQVNRIQGPLFIVGGEGTDRTGLLEREPVMLPGEINQKAALGQVVSATEATEDEPATVTISETDALRMALGLGPMDELTPESLVDKTIEIVSGPAKNKVRIITDAVIVSDTEIILTLNSRWESVFSGDTSVPTSESGYTIAETNPNFLVDETEQVDYLVVDDTDNINSFDDPALPPGTSNPFAEGELFFDTRDIYGSQGNPEALNRHRIVGFGMGSDRVIGAGTEDAFLQPGGITYEELEVVEINLGDGNNRLTVDNTIARADGFRTWTLINTGGGDDVVTINLDASTDGRLAVDTRAGDDTVDASGTTTGLPLVIFGGLGDDDITGGAGDDIIFGDRGQVDFLDELGAIVTRLGWTPGQIVGAPTEASSGSNLVDANAGFPLADPAGTVNGSLAGLYVTITVGPGVGQQRLITGNTATELFLDAPWEVDPATGRLPDETSRYLVLTTPEFQTDSVDRDPTFLRTIDPAAGGADTIDAGDGENVVFGGAGGDTISGGADRDLVVGDNGRFTLGRTDLFDEGEETSTLSINFIGSDRRSDAIDGTAGAPGARAGNWNNLRFDALDRFGSRAGELLFFDDGSIAPGITVEWARNPDSDRPESPRLGIHGQIDADGDADLALYQSYLEVNENDIVGIDVEGLAGHFETYDLYVYLDAGDRDSESGASVRSISDGTTQYFLNDADGNTFTGTYVEVTSTDPQAAGTGNYVVFRGLTGDLAQIRVGSLNGPDNERDNLPVINGLQVVGRHNPIDQLESVATDIGGDDVIASGGGGDIVIGGTGDDLIMSYGSGTRGAADADVVAGDNAVLRFMLGDLRSIRSLSEAPAGDDRIITGNGNDLVIGGAGDDTIDTGIVEEVRDALIISFNFNSTAPKGSVTGLAGAAQADYWNNLNGARHTTFGDGASETVTFNDGSAADGVTIEWGSVRPDGRLGKDLHPGSHDGLRDPDTGNERLFESYLSATPGEQLGVNISGLNAHYAVYDLYVYLDLSDGAGGPVHAISDGTTTYFLEDADGNTFRGEFVLADSTDPDAPASGNYVVFRDLTADVATIVAPGISGLQVVGGAGRDRVVVPDLDIAGGDFDRDNVVGDDGTARLFGGALYEMVSEQPLNGGNDTIRGGEGADTLVGGSGDDYLGGGSGHDLLIGDNAHLTYFQGTLLGLDRDDLPFGRIEDQGRHGDEQFGISGNRLTHITIGGDDVLEGGADDDLMFGQAGNDTYRFAGGGLGEDTAVEAGNDARNGAPNDDHDVLDFSDFAGSVTLDLARDDRSFVNTMRLDGDVNLTLTIGANTGFEDVVGSEHDDVIRGNSRDNIIVGGSGDDIIDGRDGDDLLFGDEGDDLVVGARGTDVIDGGPGDDVLLGGADPDRLMGRGGDDVLDGGPEIDDLDGGPGNDRFKGVKRDRVVDPDDESVPAELNPVVPERAERPAAVAVYPPAIYEEVDAELPAADELTILPLVADDLVAFTVGANMLASVGVATDVTPFHKRRSFTADTAASARRSGPIAEALVFDEALGAWISAEEAGLLRRIDDDLLASAAPQAPAGAAPVRIDWTAQAGVSGLLRRNPVQRHEISI